MAKALPGSNTLRGTTNLEAGECQAINDDGKPCGETKTFHILEDHRNIFADRLQRIQNAGEKDNTELKVKTLESWVSDLLEQNAMLVQAIEQLEKEASNRVAFLEEKLRVSAKSTLEYMAKLQDYDKQIKDFTGSQDGCDSKVKKLLEDLAEKEKLIGDLTLKLRKSASEEIVSRRATLTEKGGRRTDYSSWSMKEHAEELENELRLKNSQIQHFVEEIKKLRDNITKKSSMVDALLAEESDSTPFGVTQQSKNFEREAKMWKDKANEAEKKNEILMQEKVNFIKEIESLKRELAAKTNDVANLTRANSEFRKTSKEMRKALTAEVAEKHDQVQALRKENHKLEEQCHYATMQVLFKENIIKELRKEFKKYQYMVSSKLGNGDQGSQGNLMSPYLSSISGCKTSSNARCHSLEDMSKFQNNFVKQNNLSPICVTLSASDSKLNGSKDLEKENSERSDESCLNNHSKVQCKSLAPKEEVHSENSPFNVDLNIAASEVCINDKENSMLTEGHICDIEGHDAVLKHS